MDTEGGEGGQGAAGFEDEGAGGMGAIFIRS